MKVTSQIIADMAGVSRGTVDRVLHDRGGVRQEIRERVTKIAQELNYSPNKMAAALVRSNRDYQVKLIIPSTNSCYWNDTRLYFEKACQDQMDFRIRLVVVELTSDEPAQLVTELDDCLINPPDYLITIPYDTDDVRKKLKVITEHNIPLITIDSVIKDNPSPCHISTDPTMEGRIMAGLFHLAFHNENPRILILYRYAINFPSDNRTDAFIDELNCLGQSCVILEKSVITGQAHSSYHETMKLLDKHPNVDAIFIASGNSEGVCNALIDLNMNGKIKLLAFDITGKLQRYLDEGVVMATLCHSNREIAIKSIKSVIDELIFGQKNLPKSIITPNIIKIKQSSPN